MIKRKLAGLIVRHRRVILLMMLALTALSAACIGKTRINYDLNRYLSDSTMTKRALAVMNEEFSSSEQLRLMFTDQNDDMQAVITERLRSLPEVSLVLHDPQTDVVTNGKRHQLFTLTLNPCDSTALVTRLRTMFPETGGCLVGGGAAAQMDVQQSVGREIPEVMGIAVAVVLAVLLLTSHAWLEPAAVLLVLALSIVINMGTNFIFPDVSFITFAVCAILQLALSIDYAIMLLHTWNDCQAEGLTPEAAMEEALNRCITRIASSAMTTVAGLLSLLFMSFTIGFDIGLVLSKGIVISMLGVFLMMPAITLLMQRPLLATRHRPIQLGGSSLAQLILRVKKPLAAVLILLVLSGALLSSRNVYTFTDSSSGGLSESAAITEVFGESNPLVLLVPGGETDADYDLQRQLVNRLQALTRADGTPVTADISAMVTTGAAALTYYSAPQVAEMIHVPELMAQLFFTAQRFGETVRADCLLSAAADMGLGGEAVRELSDALNTARAAFVGPHMQRMLITLCADHTAPDFNACMDAVLGAAADVYGDAFYATGVPMSIYDIGHAFRSDLTLVNLITFLAILLIVALSFRAVRLPLILVFVIEGAIWITMGISRLLGQPIFFMCYLICLSIQMGATIDYGILVADLYRTLRRSGQTIPEALSQALRHGLPTVLTSGVILITAGFIIGQRCSVYYISSIGSLLARGALISVLLVLTLLPALLALLDRWVVGRSHMAE